MEFRLCQRFSEKHHWTLTSNHYSDGCDGQLNRDSSVRSLVHTSFYWAFKEEYEGKLKCGVTKGFCQMKIIVLLFHHSSHIENFILVMIYLDNTLSITYILRLKRVDSYRHFDLSEQKKLR